MALACAAGMCHGESSVDLSSVVPLRAGAHGPGCTGGTQMHRRDLYAPAGLRCTGAGGPHLRAYAPRAQSALSVQSRARASAGRWAGGLSSGEFPAGIGMAVAGAGPRPDLPLAMGICVLATNASAAVSRRQQAYAWAPPPSQARKPPMGPRWYAGDRGWRSGHHPGLKAGGSGNPEAKAACPRAAAGMWHVPPQTRSHVHCDVFG